MPRKVYRLERASNGNGPYVDNTDVEVGIYLLGKHSGCENHPAPPVIAFRGNDGWPEECKVCGFLTLKDLLNWFDEEDRKTMKNSEFEEYVVRRFEVSELLWMDDTGQCVFNKNQARPLERMSIEEAESRASKNISKWVELAGRFR